MSPKEKAKQLYGKYYGVPLYIKVVKQCCMIAIDEILPIVEGYEDALSASQRSDELEYWEEVKREIENL